MLKRLAIYNAESLELVQGGISGLKDCNVTIETAGKNTRVTMTIADRRLVREMPACPLHVRCNAAIQHLSV